MPKGRGANARRQSGRQHRPKDKQDAVDAGAQKLLDLIRHAENRSHTRMVSTVNGRSVLKRLERSRKRQDAKRKRRAVWR